MSRPGDRVGVMIGGDSKTKVVRFVGYGVYEGDFVPDETARGLAALAYEAQRTNPRLVLDDGQIAWGGETWWGDEAKMRAQIELYRAAGYEIRMVTMADVRKEQDDDEAATIKKVQRQ